MVLGLRYTHNRHRGSVLPAIPLQRSGDGVRVVAMPPGRSEAVMLGCLVAMIAGLVLMIVFVAHPSRQIGGAISAFMISLGVLEMARRYFARRKLERATLLVEPWPLRLGQSATVELEKRLRGNADVESLSARFVCFEEVKISGGKYEETRTELRHEMPLDPSLVRWTIEVPENGFPSFTVKSNRVVWRIETRTRTGGVEVPADFELLVIPEKA